MGTYVYEACFVNDKDGWFVDIPAFDGAFTDGKTVDEAAKNAAEVLRLLIAEYLDEGRPLPTPTFHNPPLAVLSVEVTDEIIALSKCVTVSEAAERLGVSSSRVSQLLSNGQLESFVHGNTRLVTLASLNDRINNKPPSHRPRKSEKQALLA